MALSAVQNLQLHNQIERVLHVPGNYRGGILEMAIVVDMAYDRERARTLCADIVTSCKRQSEVFRNIRLNMVLWGRNEIRTQTVAAARVQMGAFFDPDDWKTESSRPVLCEGVGEKAGEAGLAMDAAAEEQGQSVTVMMEYLKKFHARSKLILILTPDQEKFCRVPDAARLREALSPFLKQKLVLVYPEEMESGVSFFMRVGRAGE